MQLDQSFAEEVIARLRAGISLPYEWAQYLFPPERREYELTYFGKQRREEVIAETLAVPLQPHKSFGSSQDADWANMIIFGDNLQILKALLEYKQSGKLGNADGSSGARLIYIDPPFASKQDFRAGNDEKAYLDKLAGAEFLEFLRKRIILLKELLSDDGSLYIHLDYRRVHYVKCLCDEIFTEANFRGEIAWCYSGGGVPQDEYPHKHDTILWYSKGPRWVFNTEYREYSAGTQQRGRTRVKGENAKLRAEGTPINDWWVDVKKITSPTDPEKLYYPTQKSEELLRRIIDVSSRPGDLVIDAFAGSGTTAAVAEKRRRRWVCIDCGKLAVYTMQRRMLTLKAEIGNTGAPLEPSPFGIYNAGLYNFSQLRKLPWWDWRFFALHLFGCTDEPHRIGGLLCDGKLRGYSVLVFNHVENPGKRIDSETIADIHALVGDKIDGKFFIIAPRGVFDFQQDYIDCGNVRYYALRIPYSVISELHSARFQALRQPLEASQVNATIDAVGFDFIQPPAAEWSSSVRYRKPNYDICINIKSFDARSRLATPRDGAGFDRLSMVMIDYAYDGTTFQVGDIRFGHEITAAGNTARFSTKSIGSKGSVLFIDVYGNESMHVIEWQPRVKRSTK